MPPAVREKQPLPANPFKPDEEPIFHEAYEECLKHEQHGLEATTKGERDAVVNARCLGYFLLEAPDANGRHFIADEINACDGKPSAVDALGRRYRGIIILFRQSRGETPPASDHSSRSSFDEDRDSFDEDRVCFDEDRDLFVDPVDPAPKDHTAAKRAALRRDGYRCMVTGSFDTKAWFALDDNGREALLGEGVMTAPTNFCPILPSSIHMGPENLDEADNSKLVWKYVSAFSGISDLEELQGANTHRLSNGLTLALEKHMSFDQLLLWFEEVPGRDPDTYIIRTIPPYPGIPTTAVTFVSRDPALALPDPRYLKLHATICRVAHMSGAAKYMNEIKRGIEQLSVLCPDGSLLGFS